MLQFSKKSQHQLKPLPLSLFTVMQQWGQSPYFLHNVKWILLPKQPGEMLPHEENINYVTRASICEPGAELLSVTVFSLVSLLRALGSARRPFSPCSSLRSTLALGLILTVQLPCALLNTQRPWLQITERSCPFRSCQQPKAWLDPLPDSAAGTFRSPGLSWRSEPGDSLSSSLSVTASLHVPASHARNE